MIILLVQRGSHTGSSYARHLDDSNNQEEEIPMMGPIYIGISIGSLRGRTLSQAMAICSNNSEDNLDAVEFRFEREKESPSIWAWEIRTEEIKFFIEKFKISGAHLPFVYLNPISQNPRIKTESINQLKISIEKASELGMNYVTMHARGDAYGLSKEEKLKEWLKVLIELTEYAKEHLLILTIENADTISNLRELSAIVRQINSKWLKMTLDVGHAHVRSNPSLTSSLLKMLDRAPMPFIGNKYMPYEEYGTIKNFVEKEHDKIFTFHLHDYDGRRDHLNIGEGKIDFSFLSILKRINFRGVLIIESIFYNFREDFRRNYERLTEVMQIRP